MQNSQWMKQFMSSLFVRQVGSTAMVQGIILLVSVATGAITARWLGPGGKGQLGLLLLVPSVFQLFLGFGINIANVYYAGSGKIPVRQLTANTVAFSSLSTIAGALIVLLLIMGDFVQTLLPGVSTGYLLIAMIAVPLGLLTGQLNTILQGLRHIMTLNILSATESALIMLLTALFVIGMGLGVPGALLATLVIQTGTLIAVSQLLRRVGASYRPQWNTHVVKPTLSYGMKSYFGNLLQFFNYRLDAFIVNFFIGPAAVGIYGVAVVLAELLWQLPNAASFVLFPKSANSTPETMNRFTPRVFWAILAISSVGAIGLALFGKLLIRIVFSSAFLDAYIPMLILLPGVVLLGAAKILTNDIAGRGYPHYNSITAGLSLVITVVLNIILIPMMGLPGAALASSLSYASTLLMSAAFYIFVARKAEGFVNTCSGM